jgi:hypothetical protein
MRGFFLRSLADCYGQFYSEAWKLLMVSGGPSKKRWKLNGVNKGGRLSSLPPAFMGQGDVTWEVHPGDFGPKS